MSKFKVGEKVRVYFIEYHKDSNPNSFDGIVSEVLYERLKLDTGGCWVHEKQCRKLVKKKKSIDNAFICPCCGSSIGNPISLLKIPPIQCCDLCNGNNSFKFKCKRCGSERDPHVCGGVQIKTPEDAKFKVGDFVYLILENNIGQVKIIGHQGNYGQEYGIAVIGQRYDHGKFDVFQERTLQKLNIKCEE